MKGCTLWYSTYKSTKLLSTLFNKVDIKGGSLQCILSWATKIGKMGVIDPTKRDRVRTSKSYHRRASYKLLCSSCLTDESLLATGLSDEVVMKLRYKKIERIFSMEFPRSQWEKTRGYRKQQSRSRDNFWTSGRQDSFIFYYLQKGCSNSTTKYEAMISGLEFVLQISIIDVKTYYDLKLVTT